MCPEAVFFVCEYWNKLLQDLKKEKKINRMTLIDFTL